MLKEQLMQCPDPARERGRAAERPGGMSVAKTLSAPCATMEQLGDAVGTGS